MPPAASEGEAGAEPEKEPEPLKLSLASGDGEKDPLLVEEGEKRVDAEREDDPDREAVAAGENVRQLLLETLRLPLAVTVLDAEPARDAEKELLLEELGHAVAVAGRDTVAVACGVWGLVRDTTGLTEREPEPLAEGLAEGDALSLTLNVPRGVADPDLLPLGEAEDDRVRVRV